MNQRKLDHRRDGVVYYKPVPTKGEMDSLQRAAFRADSKLIKPKELHSRLWMTRLFVMKAKGFIEYHGRMPFLTEAGKALVPEEESAW